MRLAWRLAVCISIAMGVLCPRSAAADDAALRRTAPDECIVWLSWAGLDAFGKAGADTKNRTEQLLADEEVQAFLASLAKNCGKAINESNDEDTRAALKVARTLLDRPSVAFLTKIAHVERPRPLRAPEPDSPPPVQALILPTTQVTVGDDGLERIGIDFDFDLAEGSGTPAPPVKLGRTRTVAIDGKERTEVEVIYPNGTQWQEIQLNVNLDKYSADSAGEQTKPTEEEVKTALADLQATFQEGRHVSTPKSADAAPLPNAPPGYGAYVPTPPAPDGYTPDPTFSSGPVGSVYPSPVGAPNVPLSVPAGIELPPPPAPPVCVACETSTTTTVVHGGVVVDLGDQAAETRALFEKLTNHVSPLPRQVIAGVEFVHFEADQSVWLAFHESYFLVAFDETTAAQIVSGLTGKREAPAWLTALEKKLPVERTAARVHVNVDALVKLADEPFEEETKAAVKLLGLDQVSAISWAAGFDDVGTAVKTLIATRDGGDASALLDLFGAKGLAADDLKVIPKDATMAAAGKFDARRIIDLGLKLAALDDDEAESAWDATQKYLAEHLFIDLTKDVVESLGDTWTLHYAPSEGGLMATTFTLAVRDEPRLKLALEKLALVANADSAYVRKFTYRGQDVYYWQGGDDGGSAAWCIRDGRLVASLLPQTIKAHIARGPLKESLADVPEVGRSLDGANAGGPLVLTYTDTRGILRWCYQYGSFLLPTIGQGLAEASNAGDIDFALHDIPSLAVIEQYFAPSITTVSRTDAGLLIDSRQTVPMASGLMALTALSGFGAGMEVQGVDMGDMIDSAASLAEMPFSVSMASPVVSSQCASGQCSSYPATMPSPYWHNDDVQYFTPSAANTPQPTPPTQSKPGKWTPAAPTPPTPSRHDTRTPYGTPVPYHVPSAVGQPYVPPPSTPPSLPATYGPPGYTPPVYGPTPPPVSPYAPGPNPASPYAAGPPNVPVTYEAPREIGVPVPGKMKTFKRQDAKPTTTAPSPHPPARTNATTPHAPNSSEARYPNPFTAKADTAKQPSAKLDEAAASHPDSTSKDAPQRGSRRGLFRRR